MTRSELEDTAKEARELAEVFNAIADIVEQKLLPDQGGMAQ